MTDSAPLPESLLETVPTAGTEAVPEPAPAPEPAAETAPLPAPEPEPAVTPEPESEATPEPGATPEPEPAPMEYPEFTLPEGFSAEPERMEQYRGLLSEYRVPPEAGQRLIDAHVDALRQYAEQASAEQHRVFNETRSAWREQVKSDEQLGGAGHQTAMAQIGRMRDTLVAPERRAAFDEFLRVTGAGDHPEFLRILHNASRRFGEPSASVPSAKPPSPPRRLRDLYNSM